MPKPTEKEQLRLIDIFEIDDLIDRSEITEITIPVAQYGFYIEKLEKIRGEKRDFYNSLVAKFLDAMSEYRLPGIIENFKSCFDSDYNNKTSTALNYYARLAISGCLRPEYSQPLFGLEKFNSSDLSAGEIEKLEEIFIPRKRKIHDKKNFPAPGAYATISWALFNSIEGHMMRIGRTDIDIKTILVDLINGYNKNTVSQMKSYFEAAETSKYQATKTAKFYAKVAKWHYEDKLIQILDWIIAFELKFHKNSEFLLAIALFLKDEWYFNL
jgi:hypothetical protein